MENAVKGLFFALNQEFLAQRRRFCATDGKLESISLFAGVGGKPERYSYSASGSSESAHLQPSVSFAKNGISEMADQDNL